MCLNPQRTNVNVAPSLGPFTTAPTMFAGGCRSGTREA
jgi:hypothetical protein